MDSTYHIMSTLPEQYFSLFQQQLEACRISHPEEHAATRRHLNRELKRTIEELKQDSGQALPEVWYALGHASTFIEKNHSQAQQWYRKAAEAGHTRAATELGNRLRHSTEASDQQQSRQWLLQAAEQGDGHAMLCLGLAYRDGKESEAKLEQSLHWLQQAHLAGEPAAIKHLADLSLHPLNQLEQALDYYLQAQALGIQSDKELAEIYNTRSSPVYNPKLAKYHYEALLKKGKKSAPWVMFELAKLHASGQVSENGLTHARKWLYQITSQTAQSNPMRKKAEALLSKLGQDLF